MLTRFAPAVLLAVVLFQSLLAQGPSGGPYLNAPSPPIYRLPPVDEDPAAVEIPAADNPAANGPNGASAQQATKTEEVGEPKAEEVPTPKAEPIDADIEIKEEEDPPVGVIANAEFLPDGFRDYWKQWDASLEFGLQGTEGNSTTFNMRAGGKAERKTDIHRHTLEFTHIDNSKENIKTALSTLIDGRWERTFGKTRWSYFTHSLFEFDEFKAFDVRISADTGFGFEWIKLDHTRLLTRLGASASHEIGGPNDDYRPELSSGVEWKYKLSDRQNVFAKVDYYPDVTEMAEFRLNSKAEWEVVVSQRWGLSLKLSVIDRYDSRPSGARPNDLNYAFLMLWAL